MPVLVLLLLFLLVVIIFSITFTIMGLVLHLVVAGLVGGLAESIVGGRLPWGWVGAVLAGLVGSWLGVYLITHFGSGLLHIPILSGLLFLPLFGVPIIPALLGAMILALVVSLFSRREAARAG